MEKKLNVTVLLGCIIIGVSLLVSSLIIASKDGESTKEYGAVMSQKEVCEYLDFSEEYLEKILELEKHCYYYDIYRGTVLKYFEIDKVKYFNKKHIEAWIVGKTNTMDVYDTNKKSIKERIKLTNPIESIKTIQEELMK